MNMDEDVKKKVMLGLIVGCLVLAVGITVMTRKGGGPKPSNEPVQMLCVNEECAYAYELEREEYQEEARKNMTGMMMGPMMGPPALTCPECGQQSAYSAIKCEQCQAVFVRGEAGDQRFPDRCPECDYSKTEERMESRR